MYGCNVGIGDVHNYVLIQHNIINAIALAIRGGNDGGGGSGCKYLTMNHNTLIGVDNPDGGAIQFEYQGGGVGGCDYFSTNNNIFIARANYEPYSSAQSSPDIVSTMVASDYNLYPSSTAVTHNSTNYSLPSSKSLTSKDGHALSGAPTFTGGSSPSTIAGYALTSGSVGHNAASDGTDMGANVSLVGSGSGQRTVAPSSPNLF
jgi:hypothetical protein